MNSRAIVLAVEIQHHREFVFPPPQQDNPESILPLLTRHGIQRSGRPYQGFHLFSVNFSVKARGLGEEDDFLIRKAANHFWNTSTRNEKLEYSILAKQ
ncbi:610_t:CDS:1, partial [Acaulospora colombiana]